MRDLIIKSAYNLIRLKIRDSRTALCMQAWISESRWKEYKLEYCSIDDETFNNYYDTLDRQLDQLREYARRPQEFAYYVKKFGYANCQTQALLVCNQILENGGYARIFEIQQPNHAFCVSKGDNQYWVVDTWAGILEPFAYLSDNRVDDSISTLPIDLKMKILSNYKSLEFIYAPSQFAEDAKKIGFPNPNELIDTYLPPACSRDTFIAVGKKGVKQAIIRPRKFDPILNTLENWRSSYLREGMYRKRDIFHSGYSKENKLDAILALEKTIILRHYHLNDQLVQILRDGRIGSMLRTTIRRMNYRGINTIRDMVLALKNTCISNKLEPESNQLSQSQIYEAKNRLSFNSERSSNKSFKL